VPNIVKDITDQLKSQIATLFPLRSESRYIWSIDSNSYRTNKNLYAVRPSSGLNVTGTNRTVTIDQTFEVVLSTEFKNKGDNDASLNDAIMALYEDHEALYRLAFQRNLNISRVLVVNQVDLADPEIDNDNNIVSISSRFNIKYRTEA
jgi:hypothetical protein